MIDIFTGLDVWVAVSLVLALGFVLAFEFINGFHDTANAVATVIYTRAMTPQRAVFLSGLFNFLGVIVGGVGVAYAIVHLLPVELLLNIGSTQGLCMVFSLLAAAIIWNLGTWYFGIPASSSHALIGSILGVGLTHAIISHIPLANGVNWKKATDILLSLVISPAVGFILSAVLLVLLLKLWPSSKVHKTPEQRRELDGKKHPPFWSRLILVLSAMGLSFVHGSNDGQKGVGLIMLVLIGVVPANFVVNMDSSAYQISRTRDAATEMLQLYQRNAPLTSDLLALGQGASVSDNPNKCDPKRTEQLIVGLVHTLTSVTDYRQLSPEQRSVVRKSLLCIDDTAKKVAKLPKLSANDQKDLKRQREDLAVTTEYAPLWVIVAVALALGVGTMIGWRRVVETVGEKIGQQGMTYAQGMCAQLVSVIAIGFANLFSLPVSTTQVLSSGVAGTMVANKTGLQGGMVRTILIAWVLTLPAAMLLSSGLFWLSNKLFVS